MSTWDELFAEQLKRITAPSPSEVSEQPDTETALAQESLEEVRVRGASQDIEERKKYAGHFFKMCCWWIGIITALLLLQGFAPLGFKLPEAVILAAIGSTTVNILGILYVVANYLFPKKDNS